MEIHHIGYLVKNIECSIKQFSYLGYYVEKPIFRDVSRKSDICFMKNGEYIVELICPYEKGSPVDNLIKKIHNAPYHICYVTEKLEADMECLIKEGYLQLGMVEPAPAIGETSKVVFMMNQHIGMIELVEL